MAVIVPVLVSKKHNAATFKIVGTTTGDVGTIVLSSTITVGASGTSTFSAADKTIVRSVGDWVADGVTVGSVLVTTGTVANNGTFVVKAVTTSTVTIESNTSVTRNYLVDEAVATTYTGSYKSDLLSYGQIIVGTPKVNIARVHSTTSSFGKVGIVRNGVTIWTIFGNDDINYASDQQNTQPIVSTFVDAAGGSIILELSKIEGWSAVNPAGLPY